MITGQITADREAVIELEVRGPHGTSVKVKFVLDTGFTEFLTLPLPLVSVLALPLRTTMPMSLADGSRIALDVYDAAVVWDGVERQVGVHCVPGGALLGMSLLYGSRLLLDAVDGGPVMITAIP